MSSYEEIEQREAAMEDNSRRVRATEYEELMEFLDKENFCKIQKTSSTDDPWRMI